MRFVAVVVGVMAACTILCAALQWICQKCRERQIRKENARCEAAAHQAASGYAACTTEASSLLPDDGQAAEIGNLTHARGSCEGR